LASDVVKDELEGIDQQDLDIDELEQLAKELEAEEMERRRLRDAQIGNGSRGVEPPPLPEKRPSELEADPPLPAKDEEEVSESETLPQEVATSTSIEGMGGASLSKPLAEIEKLSISDLPTPSSDVGSKTLTVESPLVEETPKSPTFADSPPSPSTTQPLSTPPAPPSKSIFSSVADVFTPASPSSNSTSTVAGQTPERKKPTPVEVEQLKKELDGGKALDALEGQGKVSEVPSFGVKDMDPTHQPEREEAKASEATEEREEAEAESTKGRALEDRVAQAIAGGDL